VTTVEAAIGNRQSGSGPEFEINAPARVAARPRARIGGIASRVVAEFEPPEIWPALRPIWLYAAQGKQAPESGAARTACRAFAGVVSLPVHAVAEVVKWIVARPSRLVAFVVLWFLLSQTRYGAFLPWIW
jgi:hypothetical protein